MYRWFCALVLAWSTSLSGAIYETNEIMSIFEHVDLETVVFIDLDDTTMHPKQWLGSDHWFRTTISSKMQEAEDSQLAKDEVIHKYHDIQRSCDMVACEEITAKAIRGLMDQGLTVVGLTARSSCIADRTLNQLDTIGVHFDDELLASADKNVIDAFTADFYKGIIFIGGACSKGQAASEFLKALDRPVKKVLSIDDSRSHLESMEEVLGEMDIAFTGLRYGRRDSIKNDYNPVIADIQMECREKILSDEEALVLYEYRESKKMHLTRA